MLLSRTAVGVVAAILGGIVLSWEVAEAQSGSPGTLKIVRGGAGVLKGDGTPISPAYSGLAIGPGDQVGTFSRSDARVTLSEGSSIDLGSATTVIVRDLSVSDGRATALVQHVDGRSRHHVGAASSRAGTYRLQLGTRIFTLGSRSAARGIDVSTDATNVVSMSSDALVAFSRGTGAFEMRQGGGDDEENDILILTLSGGYYVIMTLKGNAQESTGEAIPAGMALIYDEFNENQGLFFFDPTAPMAEIEAEAVAEVDRQTVGNQDLAVERRERRNRAEDVEPPKLPSRDDGFDVGGNQGNNAPVNQLQVLVAAVQQTTKEPVAGNATQEILLALNQTANQAVTVNFQFLDGTAKNGIDFGAPSGTQSITFNPGQKLKSIFWLLKSDGLTEGTETFSVQFTPPSNATLGRSGFDANGMLTFTIDDP